ncbi:MAG: ketoacyl-ACP synthase III [Flavobacteriales bacterium]|nr:ketoacyl-ACP synthase III [Flavobacteriales bacterium]
MAFSCLNNISLKGITTVVPSDVFELSKYQRLEPQELKKLIKLTGIERKRHARPGRITSDFAVLAVKDLLHGLQWREDEVDLLVFVSQMRDYTVPCTAPILQDRLGLKKTTASFDVPLGCSGYPYGIQIVGSMMGKGTIEKAILIAGDINSHLLNYNDASTFPLFGDAVSATALQYDSNAPRITSSLNSDGSGFDAIICPAGGARIPVTPESFIETDHSGNTRNQLHVALDGMKIFEFATSEVVKDIHALLKYSSVDLSEIDQVFLHQANGLINQLLCHQLKVEKTKVPSSIRDFGNTSSASIPLTMVTKGNVLTQKPSNVVISGFGVGLSWASTYIPSLKLDHTKLIEAE